jgi:hypothetical protein
MDGHMGLARKQETNKNLEKELLGNSHMGDNRRLKHYITLGIRVTDCQAQDNVQW